MKWLDVEKTRKVLITLSTDVDCVDESLRDWWLGYLKSHMEHYLIVAELLNRCSNSHLENILEVGSVPGQFTVFLKKVGFHVTSIDIKPERVEGIWSKYSIPCYKLDIEREKIPVANESYDIVLFAEVLEHLRINPLFALEEIYRVLERGGYIILSIPNITPIDRIKFLIGRDYQGDIVKEFEKLSWLGHMGHFRIYSLKETYRILGYIGFKPLCYFRRGKILKGKLAALLNLTPWRNQLRSHIYIWAKK